MKLLVACSAAPDAGGGISTYARSLAEALLARGDEVHYASPAPADPSWLRERGVHHFVTDQHQEPLDAARRLLAHVREARIEGLVNNDNPVLQSIAPGLEAPMLAICHMDRRIVASLCTLHRDWIDRLVCISNDMQRTMVLRYGFPVTRCSVVHNGLEDPGHDGVFAQREPGRLRLVFSGGWGANKGSRRVLEGLLSAPDVWDKIRLDWFGHVPGSVRARTAHIESVVQHGHVPKPELRKVLAQADALLFASSKEGCPMAMLEAMSHGVLPIACDGVGAMRWLIDSGRQGFICHLARWPEQMIECVRHLCAHPELVEQMKRATRGRFLQDFLGSTNAERIVELLKTPTVDRSRPLERFRVVRWHRPWPAPGSKNSIPVRIRYRMGWLQDGGEFECGSQPEWG